MAVTLGYLRVSTIDQDVQKNKADIIVFANENNLGHVVFAEEKVSGRVNWKDRKLKDLVEDLNTGDNIIVSELSRIGRNLLDIFDFINYASQKGINLYAVKGNWKFDNSLSSKVVAFMYALTAEIERELISQRTSEGMRSGRARGVKYGRPKGPGKSKLDKYKPEIEALLATKSQKKYIAERYNTTEANLYAWMKKNNL